MSKKLLFCLGWFFSGMAIAGAVLPLLPATPFVLLAAACFSRSSPQAYRRLAESRLLGPLLRDWKAGRGLAIESKWRLVAMAGISAAALFAFSSGFGPMLVVSLIPIVVVLVVVCMVPTASGYKADQSVVGSSMSLSDRNTAR